MTKRAGLTLVKEWEGCRLTAYRCPAGVPTIGYGRTAGVRMGDKITQAQADAMVELEYDIFEEGVLKLLGSAPTTPNQLGALTSLAYNIGLNALGGSTLLRKHLARDYGGAANEFGRWVKAAGKTLPGLVKRRKAEAELYSSK